MNRIRVYAYTKLLVAIAFSCLITINSAVAQQTTSSRVRVLIYVDPFTDPKLPDLEMNYTRIRAFFDWMYSNDPSSVIISREVAPYVDQSQNLYSPISPAQILADIASLNDVRSDETLFFYYAGHGATDKTKGHWLATSGGAITRDNLREALKAKGARSVIILTDCCSSVASTPVPTAARTMAPYATTNIPDLNKLLRDLFLRSSGVVDITAATYDNSTGVGEYAWYFSGYSGLFTEVLYEMISLNGRDYSQFDSDKNNLVTWKEIYPKLDRMMNERWQIRRLEYLNSHQPQFLKKFQLDTYLAVLNSPKQTPQAFSLGNDETTKTENPPITPLRAPSTGSPSEVQPRP